jgi:aspartate racemase
MQQKLIGLIGGTSWPSTMLYYEKLNKLISTKLGGFHSARILLYSIDYHKIKSSYTTNWQKVEEEFVKELQFFLKNKPDCLIICNNTLHKAFDNLNSSLEIPCFHAGLLSAEFAKLNGCKTVLLFGTKFTMEDGFFAKYFENCEINVIIPNETDRNKIQELQTQISSGMKNDKFLGAFAELISKYKADAVCLACTEIPLYVSNLNCKMPIINPIDLQCNAVAELILQETKVLKMGYPLFQAGSRGGECF